jgi:hypothetical protein
MRLCPTIGALPTTLAKICGRPRQSSRQMLIIGQIRQLQGRDRHRRSLSHQPPRHLRHGRREQRPLQTDRHRDGRRRQGRVDRVRRPDARGVGPAPRSSRAAGHGRIRHGDKDLHRRMLAKLDLCSVPGPENRTATRPFVLSSGLVTGGSGDATRECSKSRGARGQRPAPVGGTRYACALRQEIRKRQHSSIVPSQTVCPAKDERNQYRCSSSAT